MRKESPSPTWIPEILTVIGQNLLRLRTANGKQSNTNFLTNWYLGWQQ
jgi:hypothetical protein